MKNKTEMPEGCLPFDFEKVKQGAKVRTRDGREAIFLEYSQSDGVFPVIFRIGKVPKSYTENGTYYLSEGHHLDLFLVDENCNPEHEKLPALSHWVKYDFSKLETRPPQSDKYLVQRKDGKVHWETWNGSGWAYNENSITHWAAIFKDDGSKLF